MKASAIFIDIFNFIRRKPDTNPLEA